MRQGCEVAVCPKDQPITTFSQLERALIELNRNDNLLQQTQEALLTFTSEMKRIKK